MKTFRALVRLFASVLATLALGWPWAAGAQAPLDLRLAQVGRWAIFLDAASVHRDGDKVDLRYLQVAETDFTAGDTPFWGGWLSVQIDCGPRTFRNVAFSSVRATGVEGPVSVLKTSDTHPIAGSSAEHAVAAMVCDGATPFPRVEPAHDVAAAVTLGRRLIDEATAGP